MQKTSRIYVAGGTGLVGSAMIANLRGKGYSNIISTYFRSPKPVSSDSAEIEWRSLDLTGQQAVRNFYAVEKPEFVFLAAAKVGGIMANNTYRAEYIYENLQIQNNVIHQGFLHGIKKLMFLGSTCIYPRDCAQPMKEEYLLASPLEYTNEPYALAKIAGCRMCESYNIQYNTNFISVMPTNLYGINDNFDLETSHALPAMIRKLHLAKLLMNGDEDGICKDLRIAAIEEAMPILRQHNIGKDHLTLWGSGTPKREFLYSPELADACVFLMENVDYKDILDIHNFASTDEIRNIHINIGTGKEISIHDLAELVRRIIGYKGKITFDSTTPDGAPRKLTDVSKIESLGWRHRLSLEEGIKCVYTWYLANESKP